MCLPYTGICFGGVPAWSWGYLPDPGVVPAWSWGVYLPGLGGVPGPRGVPGQVLPPVDRMTHTYENITLAQTLFAGSNERIWTSGGVRPWRPLDPPMNTDIW